MTSRFLVAITVLLVTLASGERLAAQAAPQPSDLNALVSRLSSLDYATRTYAARLVRRAPAPDAVAALTAAVRTGSDQFVRYKALILLTGFNDPATRGLMRDLLSDRNDRVREVAYRWFELHPDPGLTPVLMTALATEQAEFVRPALIRALGALSAGDPGVQRALAAEAGRGLDFFRSAVIEVLGRVKGTWARAEVLEAAKLDGPLQDDAVLALGRMGAQESLPVLTSVPARPPEPALAAQAARCLLGDDCPARIAAITEAITSRVATREAVRAGVNALAALSPASDAALSALVSLLSNAAVRSEAALGLGGVALRDPERMIGWLAMEDPGADRDTLLGALQEAFERFEEDFAEEQFYAAVRAAYWAAPESSPRRTLMASVIDTLEF